MSLNEEELPADTRTSCGWLLFAKLLKDRAVVFNKFIIPAIVHVKVNAWVEIKDESARSLEKNYTVGRLKNFLII